jgi:DNA primase
MSQIVDEILRKIDLVQLVGDYTELQEDSRGFYRGCCCVHKGSNPTSLIVIDDKIVYCHSCGFVGNALGFYCEMEGLPFHAGVESLAEKYNVSLDNNEQYQTQKSIAQSNERKLAQFKRNISKVERYLIEKRNFTPEAIEEFELGYCDDPSFLESSKNENTRFPGIIFPIHDLYNRVSSFAKRRTDGNTKPTYVNGWDDPLFSKSDTLYNLNRARKRLKDTKRLYIVEGYADVISGHIQQLAIAGYIGGYLVKGQIQLLRDIAKVMPAVEFVFAPDNPMIDPTGARECVRIREKLMKYAPELLGRSRFMIYPDDTHKDFNDLHKDNINIGELPTESIDKAVLRLMLNQCNHIENEYSTVEKFIPTVTNQMIRADISKMLAERWGQELSEVKEFLKVSSDTKADEVLSEFATVGESIDQLVKTLDTESYGIGFPGIDHSFGGVQKKEVVLIGAYSKVGKTDFICEIILHSVMRLKMNCVVFSMEMPKESLMRRLLVKLFGVNRKVLKEMLKSPESASHIAKAMELLEKYLVINDRNKLTLDEMKYRVEIAGKKIFDKPVDRVFVDYFQYMKNTEEFTDIEATAKAMKPFVKDLNCELYMLSQFSRNDRPWERPSIASFKGGNAMESSFDKAVLLWRPSKNPKMSEIDRAQVKYQTMVAIESREEMYGNDIFEMVYNPVTSRLSEAQQSQEKSS